MDEPQQQLRAFIKAAQYIVSLTVQQDVCEHLAKLMVSFFKVDWVAIAGRRDAGEIRLYYCTLSDQTLRSQIMTEQTTETISGVLDSGFLAFQTLTLANPYLTAFLPIQEGHQTNNVLLAAHGSLDALPPELLNTYLAIVALAGTTMQKLSSERGLRGYRDHLEELVHARTAELETQNARLVEEVAERQRAEDALKKIEEHVRELNAELREEAEMLEQRVVSRTAELSQRETALSLANAELAKAARHKDEFLASMSHELRTPLNVIFAFSETLEEQLYGPLNEKQLHALHTIQESSRNLLALINDILDLSKIEANKLELLVDQVDVPSVCRASLLSVNDAASKRQVTLALALDPDVEWIDGDHRRIKQILVNLLSNAIKFTAPGGHAGLDVKGHRQQQEVHFTVWDTGIGIAPEQIPDLFKPFVQLDGRRARQYEGTGLGLALISRLTAAHDGSVSVVSEPGQGSRFTVSLPWSQIIDEPAGIRDA